MHAGVRGLEPELELEAAVSSLEWVMRIWILRKSNVGS